MCALFFGVLPLEHQPSLPVHIFHNGYGSWHLVRPDHILRPLFQAAIHSPSQMTTNWSVRSFPAPRSLPTLTMTLMYHNSTGSFADALPSGSRITHSTTEESWRKS